MVSEHDVEIKKNMHDLDSSRYSFMRQVEQQCASEGKSLLIGNELQALRMQTRSTVEQIDNYKTRLEKIQHGLWYGLTEKNIDSEIDGDVKNFTSRRTLITSQCVKCSVCSKSFLKQFIDDHLLVCKTLKKPKTRTQHCNQTSEIAESIAVRPLPPRNFKVMHAGFNTISFCWNKPILDGGEPLIDYQIFYGCINSNMKAERPSKQKNNIRYSTICSRWCLKSPIPTNTFTLEGLQAATKYTDIKIRCKNIIGWSDFSGKISMVKTAGMPVFGIVYQSLYILAHKFTDKYYFWFHSHFCFNSFRSNNSITPTAL